ncbi:MAG: 50S ribosomal protein L11 methyltransferase [Thermoflexales bacterium]|nr:50S ribosomal protein L11 methyltransferase [Thermoflexales bacterium]
MSWLQVSLKVEAELAEAVADVLVRYAPGGVAFEQHALDLAGAEWQPDGPLDPLVTVYAYLPPASDWDLNRRQIEEALWHLGQIRPMPAPQFQVVAEEEWAESWKEHFHVTHIGRFVIQPSWRQYSPQPQDVVIKLDPGQAFGTGLHPTTQMCLSALNDYVRPGDDVLDLGTGSGILAIAAARLGASRVLALDIDPLAVQAARTNVAANGVEQVVTVEQGSVEKIANRQSPIASDQLCSTKFNFALVNILARVIVELFEQGLEQVLAPGGSMVLAGLIDTQEEAVYQAVSRAGLQLVQRLQDKDWVGLVCRR